MPELFFLFGYFGGQGFLPKCVNFGNFQNADRLYVEVYYITPDILNYIY